MQNSFFSDFFAETSEDVCCPLRLNGDRRCKGTECVPTEKNCDFSAVDAFPLAMAYVPFQKYENVCSPEEGLSIGTMFGDLNLPFLGRKGGRR